MLWLWVLNSGEQTMTCRLSNSLFTPALTCIHQLHVQQQRKHVFDGVERKIMALARPATQQQLLTTYL